MSQGRGGRGEGEGGVPGREGDETRGRERGGGPGISPRSHRAGPRGAGRPRPGAPPPAGPAGAEPRPPGTPARAAPLRFKNREQTTTVTVRHIYPKALETSEKLTLPRGIVAALVPLKGFLQRERGRIIHLAGKREKEEKTATAIATKRAGAGGWLASLPLFLEFASQMERSCLPPFSLPNSEFKKEKPNKM